MTQKKKKMVGTSVAAIVAASAVAVGSAFGDPSEIMDEPPESIVEVMELTEEELPPEDEDTEKSRRVNAGLRAGLRARFLSLPQLVRGVLLLPLWLLGRGLIWGSGALFSLLQAPLLRAILNLLLIVGAGALLFSALHPDEPLKNMFRRRRWLPLLALWVLLCGADSLLPLLSEDFEAWVGVAEYAVRILIPVFLYLTFRLRGKRKAEKA